MIKYAGIILLSGAISMYGAHLSYKVKEEILIRKSLFDLLIHIKCGVENGALPLEEIYRSFDSDILERTGFLQHLKSGKADSLHRAFSDSEIKLSSEIKEIYLQLSETVGKNKFKKSEIEQLIRYMSLIQAEETKLIKKDEARQELYKKLGILCGLLAALLLI